MCSASDNTYFVHTSVVFCPLYPNLSLACSSHVPNLLGVLLSAFFVSQRCDPPLLHIDHGFYRPYPQLAARALREALLPSTYYGPYLPVLPPLPPPPPLYKKEGGFLEEGLGFVVEQSGNGDQHKGKPATTLVRVKKEPADERHGRPPQPAPVWSPCVAYSVTSLGIYLLLHGPT